MMPSGEKQPTKFFVFVCAINKYDGENWFSLDWPQFDLKKIMKALLGTVFDPANVEDTKVLRNCSY
jgi:hypothetical protein